MKKLRTELAEAKKHTDSKPSSKEVKPPKTKEPVLIRRSMGVRDSEGGLIYYKDLVALLTSSTGGFFKRNLFQEGDVAQVYGVTRIGELKIRDPTDNRNKTTRNGKNVTLLD